jgi:hypothetical protein
MDDNSSHNSGQMNREKVIDNIVEMVESIKVTREQAKKIKEEIIEKTKLLEKLQNDQEMADVEKELEGFLV